MTQVDAITPKQTRSWLAEPLDDQRPIIRHISIKSDRGYGNSIEFAGLTAKEREALEAFEHGAKYLRVIDGRLHYYDVFEDSPSPESDPITSPHWKSDGTVKQFGGPTTSEGWHSPGMSIVGVGAGGTHRNEPKRSYALLSECGFICLRSPRMSNGQYWEQWVLHFMVAAKGGLKLHMEKWKEKNERPGWFSEVEEAARFLTRDLGVAYGSLDITIQRWALCNPD